MNEKNIDMKVMKYIPAKLKDHVIACDRFDNWKNTYTYNVIFDFEEETSIFADSVIGLKWACSEVLKGRRDVIYG